MLSFHNFPSYPYQQFQLIIHPFHEVFTLSLVLSDSLSNFNKKYDQLYKISPKP